MAKYECRLQGDFAQLLQRIDEGIKGGSVSASFEDGSDFTCGGARCAVRVYERYSWLGGNRVSLSVTLLGSEEGLFLSAISSGGSQAVFFKMNTLGEESFLEKLQEIVVGYRQG